MNVKAFSIYDKIAAVFAIPFFQSNSGVAKRAFEQLNSDKNSAIYHHPSDYSLFEVGEYDDQSGKMIPHEVPIHIANATRPNYADQSSEKANLPEATHPDPSPGKDV